MTSVNDATCDTVAITHSFETVVNSYDYSPFGMIIGGSETFVPPFSTWASGGHE